jgi:endonuclease I
VTRNRMADLRAATTSATMLGKDEPNAENLSDAVRCSAVLGDMVAAWYHELRNQDWQSGGRHPDRLDAAYNTCLRAVDTLEDEMVRVAGRRRASDMN